MHEGPGKVWMQMIVVNNFPALHDAEAGAHKADLSA